jgi:hypothetical protein
MADILKKGLNSSHPSGMKTPAQTRTISGPSAMTDNSYAAKKQKNLRMMGGKNK